MRKVIFIGLLGLLIFGGYKLAPIVTKGGTSNEEIISPIGQSLGFDTLGETDSKKSYTVYGYLPYWTVSEIDNFRLDLLTDISYFGIGLDAKGNIVKSKIGEEGEEINHSGYWVWKNEPILSNFFIKTKNLGISNSISVISHVDDISTEFLLCEPCWENFYEQLKPEMISMQVKDVNLNFEYYNLVEEEVAMQFTKFAEFLKRKMRKDFVGGEIVVTAMADSVINSRVPHIPSISKVADKIFIMAYDFHVKPNGSAAPVSPMGGAGVHAGYDIRTMIKDFLTYVPPQKLILGVPYYGFNWGEEVKEEEKSGNSKEKEEVKDANGEEISEEKAVNTSITQTYSQIMEKVENNEIKVLWDELGQVPYYEYADPDSGSTRKVYFENEKSMRVKYKIVKEFDLAGIGIWALGYDTDRPELWGVLEEEFYGE